jgi:leucyl/phenylalanyl-tRNA--protein transferase
VKVNHKILSLLSPRNLVLAYAQGVFPMVEQGELYWFNPDPRGLLPLDDRFHVPRRLQATVRSGRFVCTADACFDEVVRLCAERKEGGESWISPEVRLAYGKLHELGLAHSIEAWPCDAVRQGSPAGGLYGVTLGGAFFAESMFHRVTDAGKVALAHLVDRLRAGGFTLCDIQWTTENLCRFGAYEVPQAEYLDRLAQALKLDCSL